MGKGIVLQFILAVVFLKIPVLKIPIIWLNHLTVLLNEVTLEATRFMFGYLAGGATPFEIKNPNDNFIVAFQVLPLILVVSAISAALFHIGLLPTIIKAFSKLLSKTFKLSGVLSFGASATIFLGTVEAPLLIKPYLDKMGRSELFGLITCSMATIAGTVMVLYATVLEKVIPAPLGHLLTASVISVPAALIISHIMLPESEISSNNEDQKVDYKSPYNSVIEATIEGINTGVKMVVQITATIIVLFTFVYLINRCLGYIDLGMKEPLSLEYILGLALSPLMYLTGIVFEESLIAGKLMATKIVLNEFVAFLSLSQMTESLHPSTFHTLIYSLCGFANVASLGIIIGGLGSLIPNRRAELISLGGRSLLAGNIATLMTGAIVTILT